MFSKIIQKGRHGYHFCLSQKAQKIIKKISENKKFQ